MGKSDRYDALVCGTCLEEEISGSGIWKTDNLRGLLGIRRIGRVVNPRIRDLCRVTRRVDESVLRWFGYIILKQSELKNY